MQSLYDYATPERLTMLLIRERVKCCRKNAKARPFTKEELEGSDVSDTESVRLQLSRMMPRRYDWVRPDSKDRGRKADGTSDRKAMNAKALKLTIWRDRQLAARTPSDRKVQYLKVLDRYIESIRKELSADGELTLDKPVLQAHFKEAKEKDGGGLEVTCRPMSVYTSLHDKIILAITSRYLANKFNWYLHRNILSYRSARKFYDESYYVTDFNDGIALIKQFRNTHDGNIYVADCDIKKFYDTINHKVVRGCFTRMLQASTLSPTGCRQVMRVLNAYLQSYNFYENVMQADSRDGIWGKIAKRLHDPDRINTYQFKWVDESEFVRCYGGKDAFRAERQNIGVPQGGALSLMIADVVLNDVDRAIVGSYDVPADDPHRLFVRFCDDMILMHTDASECKRLISAYCESLSQHKLVYHDFTQVADVKDDEKTRPDFWHVKSHATYCWGNGTGDASAWIGFLGYEMRFDGQLRLRMSNIGKIEDKIRRKYYAMQRKLKNAESETAPATTHALGKGKANAQERLKKQKKLSDDIRQSNAELSNVLGYYKELEDNPALTLQLIRLNRKRRKALRRLSRKISRTNPILANSIRSYMKPDHNIAIPTHHPTTDDH